MLILVRHAMPAHGPHTPARAWHLSPDGRVAARDLCARLPRASRLVASTETKAIETIQTCGPLVTDRRFDEITSTEAYADDFRTARLGYVEGADHDGWERRQDAVSRFTAAVEEHTAGVDGPVVVATHGMVMTVWLTATVGLSDPGAFWTALRFPDAFVVDRSITRLEP